MHFQFGRRTHIAALVLLHTRHPTRNMGFGAIHIALNNDNNSHAALSCCRRFPTFTH